MKRFACKASVIGLIIGFAAALIMIFTGGPGFGSTRPATQFRAHICNGYHGHICMWADGKNGHLVRGRVRSSSHAELINVSYLGVCQNSKGKWEHYVTASCPGDKWFDAAFLGDPIVGIIRTYDAHVSIIVGTAIDTVTQSRHSTGALWVQTGSPDHVYENVLASDSNAQQLAESLCFDGYRNPMYLSTAQCILGR
jgi:hypothetical protein